VAAASRPPQAAQVVQFCGSCKLPAKIAVIDSRMTRRNMAANLVSNESEIVATSLSARA